METTASMVVDSADLASLLQSNSGSMLASLLKQNDAMHSDKCTIASINVTACRSKVAVCNSHWRKRSFSLPLSLTYVGKAEKQKKSTMNIVQPTPALLTSRGWKLCLKLISSSAWKRMSANLKHGATCNNK
eukprot:12431490-Karenia_brevis.AAC.1